MNYQKIYDSLMSKARTRQLEPGFYCERHHVVPKCLGGSDGETNIVKLTAEEHYLAHQLLLKLIPDNRSIAFAAHMMSVSPIGERINNKTFGWIKKKCSELQKHYRHSEDSKKKIGAIHKGKIISDRHRAAVSKARKGKTNSDVQKLAVAKANKGKVVSEETRKKLSDAHRGRIVSEEAKLNMSIAQRNKKPISEETRLKMKEAQSRRWAKARENVSV